MTESTRKAAILFRSLEPESAAVLLAQLSPAEARAVRDAVRQLGDVTDDERRGVASEVLSGNAAAAEDDGGVALELSASSYAPGASAIEPDRVSAASVARPAESPPAPAPDHPFAHAPVIEHADAATLAAYLDRENAAVVAVVLSYLPPDRAAAVLDELRFEQRTEAVERLATLGVGDPESLNVLANDLSRWITRRQEEQTRKADRLATISAILGAAAPTSREQLVDRLKARGCEWASGFAVENPAATGIDGAKGVVVSAPVVAQVDASNEPAQPTQPEPPPANPAPAPLSVPFGSLERAGEKFLAEVVRRTPPRQVLLALAGSTESLQRRVESLVPARQARELRKRVDALGPTSLRDIDAAQHAMATIASNLWDFLHTAPAA